MPENVELVDNWTYGVNVCEAAEDDSVEFEHRRGLLGVRAGRDDRRPVAAVLRQRRRGVWRSRCADVEPSWCRVVEGVVASVVADVACDAPVIRSVRQRWTERGCVRHGDAVAAARRRVRGAHDARAGRIGDKLARISSSWRRTRNSRLAFRLRKTVGPGHGRIQRRRDHVDVRAAVVVRRDGRGLAVAGELVQSSGSRCVAPPGVRGPAGQSPGAGRSPPKTRTSNSPKATCAHADAIRSADGRASTTGGGSSTTPNRARANSIFASWCSSPLGRGASDGIRADIGIGAIERDHFSDQFRDLSVASEKAVHSDASSTVRAAPSRQLRSTRRSSSRARRPGTHWRATGPSRSPPPATR